MSPDATINLSAGAPHFDTPESVAEAAREAIARHQTYYTPALGIDSLRDAIASKYERDNGLSVPVEGVFVGAGAKFTLFCVLAAVLQSGDDVIIPAPHYAAYPGLVRRAGGEPVIVHPPVPRFGKVTADDVRPFLAERTRVLILNSPNNPAGFVYSANEIRGFVDLLVEHPRLHLVSDELYEYFVWDGHRHVSPASSAPDEVRDRCITINGVSKAHGMTGWRIGYALADPLISRSAAGVSASLMNCASSISQAAAVAAVRMKPSELADRIRIADTQRGTALKAIDEIPGLRCVRPDGAIYILVEASGAIGRRTPGGITIEDDSCLADWLLEDAGLVIAPGSRFGAPPGFRLTFAINGDELTEGLQRLNLSMSTLTKGNT